jgi:hypothetical protein
MGRRELSERTSWDDTYNLVAYTADACALAGEDGDKEVGALAAPLEKLLSRWEDLDVERRKARRTIGRSHALVRRRDVQADAVVTDLHHAVLGHVKQNRKAALFTRLFPDPLSTVVRMALESELPMLRDISIKLAEGETPAAIKKAHQKGIGDALDRGEKAIRGREEAFAAAGRTSARIASFREDGNHALLGIEGALKQIASKRKLGSDWVDAFFPVVDRSKKGKEKGAVEAEPEGTPA